MLINKIDLIIAEVVVLYAKTDDALEEFHFSKAIEHLNEAAIHLARVQEDVDEYPKEANQ